MIEYAQFNKFGIKYGLNQTLVRDILNVALIHYYLTERTNLR